MKQEENCYRFFTVEAGHLNVSQETIFFLSLGSYRKTGIHSEGTYTGLWFCVGWAKRAENPPKAHRFASIAIKSDIKCTQEQAVSAAQAMV